MKGEDQPLDELAEAVLEGHSIDWASAESSVGAPERGAVRQLKVLAGIAELHRNLTNDTAESEWPKAPEGRLERWGRLEIRERIGRGSFGEVYRARDSKLDREVAVKLLHAGGERSEGAMVLKEARLLARVRHPNVVTVYDADEIEGRVGLWMEFIHGRNLEQILGERKRLDNREVTRVGIELCRALSAVHDAGLIHRDIKAQNLMQTADGRLVLMDFGTGRELEETPDSNVDAAGTPLYLAPEIFTGAQATVRSDIYSVGVLLFHLLTGAYPVRGANVREVAEAHASGQRLDLRTAAPAVARKLAAAVGQAMQADPSERFGSARDMLAALENALRERGMARPFARAPLRTGLIAAGFGLSILMVGAVTWLSRGGSGPAAGTVRAAPFPARNWVLVASFENRTGEKLFDGTLDYALGRELSNSRHVAVVSRDRVMDALRLMRKPPDSPINATLAREVCLRDGGIRALLTGRVEKLSARYLFSVELVDPKEDTALAGFSEESPGTEGSLAAIRRISDHVRAALGERPSPRDTQPAELPRVTTASLRALQLYSQADLLMASKEDSQAAAEELLRQAVAEDPAFASAWIHLAWVLHNQARPRAEFGPYAETALRLADGTTERERYFIRGSYYQLLDQREKAIAAYEALLALYPDHPWAPHNLVLCYDWHHDPRDLAKAVQVEARIADSRPKEFWANFQAGYNFIVAVPDPARAGPYLRRASELVTPEVTASFPDLVAWIELLPFTESWLKGDLRTAAREIDRVASKIDAIGERARDQVGVQTVFGYLLLGRVTAAARICPKIVDPEVRDDLLAHIAFVKGDIPALRHNLQLQRDRQSPGASENWREATLTLQASVGLLSDSGSVPKSMPVSDERSPEFHTLRGEIALAHGNLADGIGELEKAWKVCGEGPWNPSCYLGRESLAAVLAKQGDEPRAIQVLERNPQRFNALRGSGTGLYWLKDRFELARLYRRVGRVEDARVVEAELFELLAVADSDHPILLELQRLRT